MDCRLVTLTFHVIFTVQGPQSQYEKGLDNACVCDLASTKGSESSLRLGFFKEKKKRNKTYNPVIQVTVLHLMHLQ